MDRVGGRASGEYSVWISENQDGVGGQGRGTLNTNAQIIVSDLVRECLDLIVSWFKVQYPYLSLTF